MKNGVSVLTVKTVAHAEELLAAKSGELQSALNLVKLEYVVIIRMVAEAARDDQLKCLRAIRPPDPGLSVGTFNF